MTGLAHSACAHLSQANHVERAHGQLEALADFAQQGSVFELHVVKEQFQVRCAAQAHHHLVFADGEACQALVDHEHGNFLLTRFGRDQEKVTPDAVADEVLATVEYPALVVLHSCGFYACRVRACTWLGDGDGAGACALDGGLEPAIDLLAFAVQEGLIHIAKGAANDDVGGMAKLLLAQDAVQVGQASAAKVFGHVHAVQAQSFGLFVQGFGLGFVQIAFFFHLVFQRLAFLSDETAHRINQHFLFVVE